MQFNQLKKLIKDHSASAAIEFAMVLPIFAVFLLFFIELCLIYFSQIAIEDSVTRTIRQAKIGAVESGIDKNEYIISQVRNQAFGLINPEKLVVNVTRYEIEPHPHYPIAEDCLNLAKGANGRKCPCLEDEPFDDANNNGTCDIGPPIPDHDPPGEIYLYTITYRWHTFSPIWRAFGLKDGTYPIFSGGAVRNDPPH